MLGARLYCVMLKCRIPSVTAHIIEKCALERRGQETGPQRQETELHPEKGSENHLSPRWPLITLFPAVISLLQAQPPYSLHSTLLPTLQMLLQEPFNLYFNLLPQRSSQVFIKTVERNTLLEGTIDWPGQELRVLTDHLCCNVERSHLNKRK